MKKIDSIKEKLSKELTPTVLAVEDDSLSHAGHKEAGESGESHFNVTVVSAKFEGMALVQRHKKIYAILADEISGGIHALSLHTLTPAEYEKRKA